MQKEKTNVLQVGDLTLDQKTHLVKRGEKEISLSGKEFNLLRYMMLNKGIVLTFKSFDSVFCVTF